ncbi:polysaccharide deacetylase family protein [bacterium]|nr:polysaccharide deacetylase family protein [bacterium]MBU1153755.1 polysaccharide deacetylase family protein [bacterium]MBU1782698.1 polysaccharide deacetylase family protein [bacterium]
MSLRNTCCKLTAPLLTPIFKGFQKDKIIILMYHRILNLSFNFSFDEALISATPQSFETQMSYLKNKYEVINFNDLHSIVLHKEKIQRPKVIITFDDGYLDNYLYAYPILKRYRLPALIFLTTDYIEGKRKLFWWDEVAYLIKQTKETYIEIDKIGSYFLDSPALKKATITKIQSIFKKITEEEKNKAMDRLRNTCQVETNCLEKMFLSWEQVKEMSKDNISFGAHTCSHVIASKVSLAKAKEEIVCSKKIIEEQINQEVKVFAYPNGKEDDYNQEIIKILQENKFHYAVLTIDGSNSIESIAKNPYILRRVGLRSYDHLDYFKLQLCGALVKARKIRDTFFNKERVL